MLIHGLSYYPNCFTFGNPKLIPWMDIGTTLSTVFQQGLSMSFFIWQLFSLLGLSRTNSNLHFNSCLAWGGFDFSTNAFPTNQDGSFLFKRIQVSLLLILKIERQSSMYIRVIQEQ